MSESGALEIFPGTESPPQGQEDCVQASSPFPEDGETPMLPGEYYRRHFHNTEQDMRELGHGFALAIALAAAGVTVVAEDARGQSAADSAAIVETARDYIIGWYEGDSARMERALHPQLAKRIVRTGPDGRSTLGHMTAAELVRGTRSGGGRNTPSEHRRSDIRILDAFGGAASVRVDAANWVDYLHLAKSDGRWLIVNVLWELRPRSPQASRQGQQHSQPEASGAQPTVTTRSELLAQFNSSMSRVIALAGTMPPASYAWRPESAAMPVGQVYGHIARYNYYYLASAMGVAAPSDIKLDTLEAMRDKAQLVQLLRRSADHVRSAVGNMSEQELQRPTVLYGRSVPRWAVLLQLVTHMNEHLGQSIAYARSNEVVPPWSR